MFKLDLNTGFGKFVVGQQLTPTDGNSGKTGGGSAVFASLTRLPLILWRDGSTG
jgi:hypothetical protein